MLIESKNPQILLEKSIKKYIISVKKRRLKDS